MTKINYVIPCWSGSRRMIDPFYDADKTLYLKTHLQELNVFHNHLSQITLVINQNPSEPSQFTKFIEELSPAINNVPLVVLRRPSNLGMTFGAWSFVYDTYGDYFTHYIFGEDDYCPAINFFDEILLRTWRLYEKVGFLCPSLTPCHYGYNVPKFAIGITPSECLADLKRIHGVVPYTTSDQYAEIDKGMTFHSIIRAGWGIERIGNYSVVVLRHDHDGGADKRNGWFSTYESGPLLFVPIQYTARYRCSLEERYS